MRVKDAALQPSEENKSRVGRVTCLAVAESPNEERDATIYRVARLEERELGARRL